MKIIAVWAEKLLSRKAAYPTSCYLQFFAQVSRDCFPVWTLDVWNKGCHWLFQSPVILIAYIKFSLWWDLILLILYFVLGKKDKNRKKGREKNQGGREKRKGGIREEKKQRGKDKPSFSAYNNFRWSEKILLNYSLCQIRRLGTTEAWTCWFTSYVLTVEVSCFHI